MTEITSESFAIYDDVTARHTSDDYNTGVYNATVGSYVNGITNQPSISNFDTN